MIWPAGRPDSRRTQLTCGLGERPPAALAVGLDVGDEALVLLLGPGALVRVSLLAAR